MLDELDDPDDDTLWMLAWYFSLRCLLFGHRRFPRDGRVTVWSGMDDLKVVPCTIKTCTRCGSVSYGTSPAPRMR